MFERFASLTRFSHGWTVTEKIDGTNACVVVAKQDHEAELPANLIASVDGFDVFAQSRNNMIVPGKDNMAFAHFVHENADLLVSILGEGRHYGEWAGAGIQRRYGMDKKVFALFNAARWGDLRNHKDGGLLGGKLTSVPVLAEGYMGEPGAEFARIMEALKENGSAFAPGFMDPEGIVMRHGPSGTLFKKTFDYDEQGKWAENQARKQAAK